MSRRLSLSPQLQSAPGIPFNIDVFDGMHTLYDALKFLNELNKRLGFVSYAMVRAQDMENDISTGVMATNCPVDLINSIADLRMLKDCTTWANLGKSTLPVEFSVSGSGSGRSEERNKAIQNAFARWDIASGVLIPWHGHSGLMGVLAFMGSRPQLSKLDLNMLHLTTIRLFDRFYESHFSSENDKPILTHRERDCLEWTSNGKTSAETAQIMKLSEHTVNHYLTCAMRKLDAVNRTHAVVRAIRSGEIK